MPAKGEDSVFGAEDQLTGSLATAVGGYLLLSAAGVLSRRDAAAHFVESLRGSPALAHVTGAVAFFVGAGLLLVHHRWDAPLEALVSAVAVWWLVEGGAMLALGPRLLSRADAPIHFRRMNGLAIPTGLILLAGGLMHFWSPPT